MNISPVSIAPNHPVMSDGQGTNTAVTENDTEGFNQMLQALSSGVPAHSGTDVPITNKSITWPMVWLEILGQSPNGSGPALDLLEEAPNLANQSTESAISLTEIMTALQPIVTESQLATATPLADDLSNDDTEQEANVIDETNLALLTLMSGFSPLQPATVAPPLPSLPVATESLTNQVAQSVSAWPLPTNGEFASKGQNSLAKAGTQAEVIANLKSTEVAAVPTETTPVTAAPKVNSAFAQELGKQMVATPVSPGTNQPAETTSNDITEPALKPKVQVTEATSSPVLSAEPFNVQNSTFNVQTAPVEAKVQLPEVPALHQIVDRIRVMTQHGQTEVQLHLHPESLGQLSIQLHMVDGDIAVRMVTETAQAQKLIQDHLPQLKAAFTTQGLQLNDMAVAVGSGASSFDLSGHRPNNNWSQQPAHSQTYPTLTDKPEPTTVRPVLRTWSNGYAVDYQV